MMNENEKQLIFYFFELIASLLIGSFVALTYNEWYGTVAGGLVLFISMVCNVLIFRKNLATESTVLFGFISLLALSLGLFYTYGMIFAVISVFINLIVIFFFIFFIKKTGPT